MSEDQVVDDGGQAFPTTHDGMTLRDWFAGMALQGLLAGSENMSIDTAARLSYTAADMMIAERAKR